MKTRWFRYTMETPDDGAGGGGEEPEGHVSVFERADLWDPAPSSDDDPGDPAAADPEPPAADAPVERPDGWNDEDWGAFQKKYPGGSPADLWKHYRALESDYSRVKNGVPPKNEPAPAPEPTPTPESWRAHNFSALGDIPVRGLSNVQREQLGELMGVDPEAAASWALANAHLLKEDEFNAVQNTWAQADPHGYRTFWAEQEELQRTAALEEQVGPTVDYATQQRQREGAQMAQAAVPDITAHLEPFKEWLEARPDVDQHFASLADPEQVKNAIIATFYQFYGPYRLGMDATEQAAAAERERVAAEEAATAAAAAETSNRRAVTATAGARQSPAAAGEATAQDIKDAIKNARTG